MIPVNQTKVSSMLATTTTISGDQQNCFCYYYVPCSTTTTMLPVTLSIEEHEKEQKEELDTKRENALEQQQQQQQQQQLDEYDTFTGKRWKLGIEQRDAMWLVFLFSTWSCFVLVQWQLPLLLLLLGDPLLYYYPFIYSTNYSVIGTGVFALWFALHSVRIAVVMRTLLEGWPMWFTVSLIGADLTLKSLCILDEIRHMFAIYKRLHFVGQHQQQQAVSDHNDGEQVWWL